jgi:hypothetical protein
MSAEQRAGLSVPVEKYRFWSALVRREISAPEFSAIMQMDVQEIRRWCAAEVPARYDSLVASVLRDKALRHYADCRIPVEKRFLVAVSDDRDGSKKATQSRVWVERGDCEIDLTHARNFRAFGFGTTFQTRNGAGGFDLVFRFLPGHAAGYVSAPLR